LLASYVDTKSFERVRIRSYSAPQCLFHVDLVGWTRHLVERAAKGARVAFNSSAVLPTSLSAYSSGKPALIAAVFFM
jgi:hypothetical protein